ncbi:hypothetical protein [Pseudomonas extremaustralis]|uniref:hypothetical protein n=1 Tax=Pseudomonas extremaustralis TaxID=359110 RepID=UPI0028646B55|nr:hypothetical protein [Pseudomonas extremaustralis]MDR6575889.1 hypothetical protein [Pseudomonas extremaustralis]
MPLQTGRCTTLLGTNTSHLPALALYLCSAATVALAILTVGTLMALADIPKR